MWDLDFLKSLFLNLLQVQRFETRLKVTGILNKNYRELSKGFRSKELHRVFRETTIHRVPRDGGKYGCLLGPYGTQELGLGRRR